MNKYDRRRMERHEDLRWMSENGESLSGAAIRMGLSEDSLIRWCEKHDPSLLVKLKRNGVGNGVGVLYGTIVA